MKTDDVGFEVIVLIIIVLMAKTSTELAVRGKKALAFDALSRMVEQIEKTPGVLDRMIAFGCHDRAADVINDLR